MQELRNVIAQCVHIAQCGHILGNTSDDNLQTALYITLPVAGFLDQVVRNSTEQLH
jgi:hypothetical protein